MSAGDPTKTQEWFRAYSGLLATSYRASALVGHATTKGDAREDQVVKVLKEVLPRRVTLVERPFTIIDADGAEADSFDAAVVNGYDYPRLFADGLEALMVESVYYALEIKSTLDGPAVADIFKKAASLRALELVTTPGDVPTRVTVAFAYSCENLNLRFLDFAIASRRGGDKGATAVCVLNQGVLGLLPLYAEEPRRAPYEGSIPCLFEVSQDALLLFVYLLIHWLESHGRNAWIFERYSEHLLSSLEPQTFGLDFLDALRADTELLRRAREAMRGMGGVPFADAYARAQASI